MKQKEQQQSDTSIDVTATSSKQDFHDVLRENETLHEKTSELESVLERAQNELDAIDGTMDLKVTELKREWEGTLDQQKSELRVA